MKTISAHQRLKLSKTVGANMDTSLPSGQQLIFFKHEEGGNFLAAIEESQLHAFVRDSDVREVLKDASGDFDRVIIAKIEQEPESPCDYLISQITEPGDPLLDERLNEISERFWSLLDNYGKWESFRAFLVEDNLLDDGRREVGQQLT